MKVRVKEEGIKLYERNKDFVDIIEDEEGPNLPQIPSKEDEEPKQSDANDAEDAEKEKTEEEILMELRMKAKELGIKNYHLMGKEKLETAIAEKEAPLFGANPEENDVPTQMSAAMLKHQKQILKKHKRLLIQKMSSR